ncbi:hypothetical protein [Cohnella sp. AR92]|uniref:hypothetical protein n=1 Tax=Cohnella sp. AR92 TaxID=648716 RepID=UPI0013158801|nr:hypothetical protein [Cohnella sp. AR92]
MTLPSSRNRKRDELDRWKRLVTNDNPDHKALNLYGAGGIGKSFMLGDFRRR